MDVETIIDKMRHDGWLLLLSSTFEFASAKYSAVFARQIERCDDCDQYISPLDWEDHAHGDTIEEAVRAAFERHFELGGGE